METLNLAWGLLWRTSVVYYIAWLFVLGISQAFGLSQPYWVSAEVFLKLKPTISEWSFGLLVLFVTTIFNRSLIGIVFGSRLKLSVQLWRKFDFLLIGILCILGALNWAVAFSMSTEVWVNFKLFISGGIYVFLMICVAGWLNSQRHNRNSAK